VSHLSTVSCRSRTPGAGAFDVWLASWLAQTTELWRLPAPGPGTAPRHLSCSCKLWSSLAMGPPLTPTAWRSGSTRLSSGPRLGWVSLGVRPHWGPLVLMIENHRSGLVRNLMRRCQYVVTGMSRAGFTGGWL
jgi:hypothetical protein